ncbi:ZIP family metal transporter [Persephonella sp.]
MATGLGGSVAYLKGEISKRTKDILLGFSAGIMLAASFFSLLNPAVEILETNISKSYIVAIVASLGFLLGAVLFWFVDKTVPEDYFMRFSPDVLDKRDSKKIWIFVLAITVHNFPEGMSSALGFMTGDIGKGVVLASGIGIQNIPEGLAVAVALLAKGFSKNRAVFIAFLTGLVEPIGGILGLLVFGFSDIILPIGLAFSAGAMVFVISKEIIPETHKRGFEIEATTGLIIGFILMMFLDLTFG